MGGEWRPSGNVRWKHHIIVLELRFVILLYLLFLLHGLVLLGFQVTWPGSKICSLSKIGKSDEQYG